MQKFIRYAAYLAAMIQIGFTIFLTPQAYGDETLILLLLAILPVLTIIALYLGPDLEEKRLLKIVRKARLEDELKSLGYENSLSAKKK